MEPHSLFNACIAPLSRPVLLLWCVISRLIWAYLPFVINKCKNNNTKLNRYIEKCVRLLMSCHHNRESGQRRCAAWLWPRCTALPHCNWMDASECINGLSHVSALCPRSPPWWGWGAHAAGTNCEFERIMSWCPFSKSDHVSKQCRPTCGNDALTRGSPARKISSVAYRMPQLWSSQII